MRQSQGFLSYIDGQLSCERIQDFFIISHLLFLQIGTKQYTNHLFRL